MSSQPKWSKLGTNVHIGLNKSEIIKKAEFSDSALIFQVLKLTVYICSIYILRKSMSPPGFSLYRESKKR